MAAYDVNPKYTTANNSYTHRRRKSSLIKDLVMRGDESRYQPQYQDWRYSISGPDNVQSDAYSVHRTNRRCSSVKVLASILLVVSFLLGGMWIFAGEMPLASIPTLPKSYELTDKFSNLGSNAGEYWKSATENIDLAKLKGEIDWRTWKIQKDIKESWKLNQRLQSGLRKMKRWVSIPGAFKRSDSPWTEADAGNSEPSTVRTSAAINTDLLSFTPETFGTRIIAQMTSNPVGEARFEPSQGHDTVLGRPVQVRQAPTDDREPIIAEPLQTSVSNLEDDGDDDDGSKVAHQKRVEEMWKKHASHSSEKEDNDHPSSVAGTLAEGVSPSTET